MVLNSTYNPLICCGGDVLAINEELAFPVNTVFAVYGEFVMFEVVLQNVLWSLALAVLANCHAYERFADPYLLKFGFEVFAITVNVRLLPAPTP